MIDIVDGLDLPPDVLSATNPDFPDWADGYVALRPSGRPDEWVALMPLFGARWRVTRCTDDGCGEHWCFPVDGTADAVVSFLAWPDPPVGWSRWFDHDRLEFVYPDGRRERA